MDSTSIPDQNSTAVSIRGGLGASASAASILSGQTYTVSGQLSTTASKTTTASKASELENTQRK